MPYRLVIFDNDGTLVDSEPVAHRVLSTFLTELGYPFTLEESYRHFLGTATHMVPKVIKERFGGTLPDDFFSQCHERIFAEFDKALLPSPGAIEVLTTLRERGIPYCVASSSAHTWIDLTLTRSGLRHLLPAELVFSSQDVGGVGKPAPDLFLHAARMMDVTPSDCLAIEDSPNGVLAARSAGMDVLGYASLTPASRLLSAGATGVITDLLAVVERVRGAGVCRAPERKSL